MHRCSVTSARPGLSSALYKAIRSIERHGTRRQMKKRRKFPLSTMQGRPLRLVRIQPSGLLPTARAPPTRTIFLEWHISSHEDPKHHSCQPPASDARVRPPSRPPPALRGQGANGARHHQAPTPWGLGVSTRTLARGRHGFRETAGLGGSQESVDRQWLRHG